MRTPNKLLITAAFHLIVGTAAHATIIYQNAFDSGDASLNGLTSFGSGNISVASGQLTIGLSGSAHAGVGLDVGAVSPDYSNVLRLNPGTITWALNVANQDGPPNNLFNAVLACNSLDPYGLSSVGYALMGGGFVGDRMMLYRFDHGLGGGGRIVIDIPSTNGLGTLPAKGSFKIVYDASSDNWTVFGQVGAAYVDPTLVSTSLGGAVDSTYTSASLPYFSLAGLNGGADYFDNLSITMVPEPAGLGFTVVGGLLLVKVRKGRAKPA